MKSKSILIEKYIEPSETEIRSDGVIIQRWFDRNDDLHSFMGQPAYIKYYNGQISYKRWHKKGVLHRDVDQPAEIWYNSNGQIDCQVWYKKGELYRNRDLPAYVCYNNGQISYQWWYKNGQFIKSKSK